MSVKSLWGQVIAPADWCETAAMANQGVRGGNKICQQESDFVVKRVQADSSAGKKATR